MPVGGKNGSRLMYAIHIVGPSLLLLVGCQAKSDFMITGQVTLDGEPIRGATIEFLPDQGVSLLAVADEHGKYEVRGQLRQSAASATYVVRVTTGGEMLNAAGEAVVVSERVPARYNEQSELKIEVSVGNNQRDLLLATGKTPSPRMDQQMDVAPRDRQQPQHPLLSDTASATSSSRLPPEDASEDPSPTWHLPTIAALASTSRGQQYCSRHQCGAQSRRQHSF